MLLTEIIFAFTETNMGHITFTIKIFSDLTQINASHKLHTCISKRIKIFIDKINDILLFFVTDKI